MKCDDDIPTKSWYGVLTVLRALFKLKKQTYDYITNVFFVY